jgi:hypothetical protein
MRIEFIECACRKTAQRRAPWAVRISKVEGGYMAFESVADSQRWKAQR